MGEKHEKVFRGSINSIISGSSKYLIHGFSPGQHLRKKSERIGNTLLISFLNRLQIQSFHLKVLYIKIRYYLKYLDKSKRSNFMFLKNSMLLMKFFYE